MAISSLATVQSFVAGIVAPIVCVLLVHVIALPPDFLRGACSPHLANDEKRYRLYRSFWGLLNTLSVWRDEEYLQRKEQKTVRGDKRDIIPKCVITVSYDCTVSNC